jgi:hypothetical protein
MIYKFPQSEPGFNETWPLTLLANRVRIVEAYGRFFYCLFATGKFQMSFNNGKYFDVYQGSSLEFQPDERYNSLRLLSASDQSVVIITGNMRNSQTSVATIIQAAKTRAVPGANTIAAGANVDLTAIPAGCTYRKGVIFANNDAAVDLDVYTQDAAGAYQKAGTVLHQQSWQIETSDPVRLNNPGGSTVNCRILELFYISQ